MKEVPRITPSQAASLVKDGDVLLAGGFGMTGSPVGLLHALAETQVRNLTFIGNNVGEPGIGGGRLLRNGQLKKMIGSFFTSNPEAVQAAQHGEIEYELLPQGTLAEAIRAGGAGIGGFYTPTSAGTLIAQGRDTRVIDGIEQVFVKGIKADVAFIRAWKADTAGNLQYRMTEQNFNRAMAAAADIVVAEAQEIVPVGRLDPNIIHTPGNFIDYLVQRELRLDDLGTSASVGPSKRVNESRLNMARRAFRELRKGDVVNLGIGIPTLAADLISPEDGIILHTENGMLGVGPEPSDGGGALDYPVNAGKVPVTALPGSSYFDSAESFGMIRGGHVDVAIMGGLEIDKSANLANWTVPGKPLLGVGGAMDLASGAKRLIVTMAHTNHAGESKIVPECRLPVTAYGCVDLCITDLAVFKYLENTLTLIELMPGASLDEVRYKTQAHFKERLS